MPDAAELKAVLQIDLARDAKSLLGALSKGVGVGSAGGVGGGASTNSPSHIEVKGLLSKIAAGVAFGNVIVSTFHEFLRPIFQMIKVFVLIFLFSFMPLITIALKALSSLIPAATEASKKTSEGIQSFIDSKPEGKTEERAAAVGAGGGMVIGGVLAGPVGALVGGIVGPIIAEALYNFGFGIGQWLRELYDKFLLFISPFQLLWDEFWQVGFPFVIGMWIAQFNGAVTGITSTIKTFVDGVIGFISGIKGFFVNGLKSIFNSLMDAIFGAINGVIGLLKTIKLSIPSVSILGKKVFGGLDFDPFGGISPLSVPHLDTGGRILETGIAKVHKGETVVPAGKGGSVNYSPTYNISADVDNMALKRMLQEHDREFLGRLKSYGAGTGRFYST